MKTSPIIGLVVLLFFTSKARAQNVRISPTGSTPDASAMLDVTATNKGLLMPRVSLTSLADATTISSPAPSLLVYNTNAAVGGGAGYYYNAGTAAAPVWTRFITSGQSANSYFGNASLSVTTGGTTSYLGGFPVTVNVPDNATVIMTINAGAQTTGTTATDYSTVNIFGYVDGVTPTNSCSQRLQIANSTGLSNQLRYANFTETLSLTSGSHTFGIAAALAAGSTATVGGNSASVLQSVLTLTIIKN